MLGLLKRIEKAVDVLVEARAVAGVSKQVGSGYRLQVILNGEDVTDLLIQFSVVRGGEGWQGHYTLESGSGIAHVVEFSA